MDGTTLDSDLRDDLETELSRLGSSKWLYALTGGDMDADAVRASAAGEAAASADTFGTWADDESDDAAADLFAGASETLADHRDGLDAEAAAERRVHEVLGGVDDTVGRVGGLLGWGLVAGKTAEQYVGFFVGSADPQTADTFRSIRDDVRAVHDDAAAVLDEVCDDEDDWARARESATAVVETAYDDYVETLESMGIKPKNVC